MGIFLLHSVQTDEYGEPIDTRELVTGLAENLEEIAHYENYIRGYRISLTGLEYFVVEVERNKDRIIRKPWFNYINLDNAKQKYKELASKNECDVYIFYQIYDGREQDKIDIQYIMSHLVD